MNYMFYVPIFKYKVFNWNEVKPKLIEILKDYPLISHEEGQAHTDYINYGGQPPYIASIWELLSDTMSIFLTEMKVDKEEQVNIDMWHQRYDQHEAHAPHSHASVHFGCTLYLNYNKDIHPPTTFYAPFLNYLGDTVQYSDIEASEGDITIFPASTLHQSPPNQNKIPKEIIAMNLKIPALGQRNLEYVQQYYKENDNDNSAK